MTQDERRLEVFERVVGTVMPHEAPNALADHIIALEARIAELEARPVSPPAAPGRGMRRSGGSAP